MIATGVAAQPKFDAPRSEDLQAAYCIGYLSLGESIDVETVVASYPKEKQAEMRANMAQRAATLAKTRGYLLARTGHIDSTGLLVARKQAETDFNFGMDAVVQCVQACSSQSCAAGCKIPAHISSRQERCAEAEFLPY